MTANQNPEQKTRDKIDALLKQAGWKVQDKKNLNLNDGPGQAVREFQTDIGPADYVLFVGKKAVGVIEAKRPEEGQTITTSLHQAEALRQSILKKAFSGQLAPQGPNDEPASALLARIKAEKTKPTHPPSAKGRRSRSNRGISVKEAVPI